jgi:hypothetical protein
VTGTEIALLVVCSVCLVIAAAAVVQLRPRLSKHPSAALSFAAPGVLAALSAAWMAAHGPLLAVAPTATITALCFAASALFVPTAATRFAAFERDFWAHVHRQN